MKIDVILGLQWGDEGKGKIVDVFTPRYDIIARFQGGPNAGHTLEFNGEKHILHTIPSGIFHKSTKNVIGNGVIIDPYIFSKEVAHLLEAKVDVRDNLLISNKSHLILPIHRLLDAVYEKAKGKDKIGSTLKGIGPCYTDKVSRIGLRVGDLLNDGFKDKYMALREKHLNVVGAYGFDLATFSIDNMSFEAYEEAWFKSIDILKSMPITDTEIYINKALAENKKVLAEGAQGSLLDVEFGSYPFVTSSNTLASGVCSGLGVAPHKIGRVFGIFKAYCTRVGSGPFPTELFGTDGKRLQDLGHEFGSTTGRARRCGWLDLPALRYAIMLNGVTDLVITKADVMDTFESIQIAKSYTHSKDQTATLYSSELANKEDLSINYDVLDGWQTDITNIRQEEGLPENFSRYISYVEKATRVPISIISVGPDRTQSIIRKTAAI